MSFRWAALLKSATQALTEPASEASLRTSINRSYYAALGEARDLATRHGYAYARGRGGSHQQVWTFLRNSLPAQPPHLRPAGRSLANAGEGLRQLRVLADYHSATTATRADAINALAQANQIVDKCLKL